MPDKGQALLISQIGDLEAPDPHQRLIGSGQHPPAEQGRDRNFASQPNVSPRTFAINVKGPQFTVQKGLPFCTIPAFSVNGATEAAIRNFARHWLTRGGWAVVL